MRSINHSRYLLHYCLMLLVLLASLVMIHDPLFGYRRLDRMATSPTLNPSINIVPSSDGSELFIQASNLGQLNDILFANIDTGPTGHKGGYTMAYSDTLQSYITTIPDFTPAIAATGSLNITTTHGLSTGVVDFQREYITGPNQQLASVDGHVLINIVNQNTVPSGTYLLIVPSIAAPGPAPSHYRLIGQSYSLRASGALTVANQPMLMQWFYDPGALGGASADQLALFAWDSYQQQWQKLGGQLSIDQSYLSLATTRFTTYALMAPVTEYPVYLPFVER